MPKVTSHDKKKFAQKLLWFTKNGLLQYGNYLEEQLKFAAKAEIHKHHKIYIEGQIIQNDKRIQAIDEKL